MLFEGMFWFFPAVILRTNHNRYRHRHRGQLLQSSSGFTPNLQTENQSEQSAQYRISSAYRRDQHPTLKTQI